MSAPSWNSSPPTKILWPCCSNRVPAIRIGPSTYRSLSGSMHPAVWLPSALSWNSSQSHLLPSVPRRHRFSRNCAITSACCAKQLSTTFAGTWPLAGADLPGRLVDGLASAHPLNLRAHSLQLFLDALVAAVHVVHAIEYGLPVRHQRGQNQRSRGTQVRTHY